MMLRSCIRPQSRCASTVSNSDGSAQHWSVHDCAQQAGDAAMRSVPPSRDAATRALRIDGFVRPLTAKACKEMLAESGGGTEFTINIF